LRLCVFAVKNSFVRNFKEVIIDIGRKAPILFPLVGGFHLLWLGWTIWTNRTEQFPSIIWLGHLWMLGYTIFWLAACDLKKWGALGYLFLTLLNSSLYLAQLNGKIATDYISSIPLIDGLFSFFLFFYYKRFS